MSKTSSEDTFIDAVSLLRTQYQRKRDRTNLVPPTGRPVIDQSVDVIDSVVYYHFWYEVDSTRCQYIRLANISDTLSGDILRLRQNLPMLDGDYEINGDQIHLLKHVPPIPDVDDDSEDLSAALESLLTIVVDSHKHFVKKGKYESEIRNLLKCQGGSCPGVPQSSHIVQLLGKSSEGELVFHKLKPRRTLSFIHPLATYRNWILQVISGLKCLHSLGIVHRDLRIDNLVFASDDSHVLICDLESRWGNRLAPEISRNPVLDAAWSTMSDVYDLAYVIQGMIYGNIPITNVLEWPVPRPLDAIIEACTRDVPEERPSLDELYAMVEKIEVHAS